MGQLVRSILIVLAIFVLRPAGARPPPSRAETAAARGHLATADANFDAGLWDAAIGGYLAAYSIIPEPMLIWNVARAYEEKQDFRMAIDYYERYAKLPNAVPRFRRSAAVRIAAIRHLQLIAGQGGEPSVPASEPSGASDPASGASDPIPLAGSPTRGLTVGGWTSASLGVAAVIAGAVVLGLGASEYETVDEAPVDDQGLTVGLTQAEALEHQARGERLTIAGGVLVGVGGAAMVTGVILLMVSEDAEEGGTARVAPSIAPVGDGWFVGATARF